MEPFFDGLWKGFRKGLGRVLGSLGGLLGGSMFHIHCRTHVKTQISKNIFFVIEALSGWFWNPSLLVLARSGAPSGDSNLHKPDPKLNPNIGKMFDVFGIGLGSLGSKWEPKLPHFVFQTWTPKNNLESGWSGLPLSGVGSGRQVSLLVHVLVRMQV